MLQADNIKTINEIFKVTTFRENKNRQEQKNKSSLKTLDHVNTKQSRGFVYIMTLM